MRSAEVNLLQRKFSGVMFQSTPLKQSQLAQLFLSHLKPQAQVQEEKTQKDEAPTTDVTPQELVSNTQPIGSHTVAQKAETGTHQGDSHLDMCPANDGLKWRKYGRKQLRNGGFPRDYYRCTVAGCNARKQVERVTDQSGKLTLNTTYLGEHTHDTPKFSRFAVTTQVDLIDRVMKAFEEMACVLFTCL